jgi:hypothetical protein
MSPFLKNPGKSWLLLAVAAVLLPALLSGSPDAETFAQPPKTGDFVHFEDHLKHLLQAKHEHYKDRPGVKVASAAHFNEMKAHLQNMYKDLKVTHTFIGHDGQHVDVVAIDKQPSLRHPLLKNHKLQRTPPALRVQPKSVKGKTHPVTAKHVSPHLAPGMKDKHGHAMYSPPGSIAMRRLTLDDLTKFRTLKDYLKKHASAPKRNASPKVLKPEFVDSGGNTHRYAHASQTVDNFGGSSWLNLWSPVPADGQFSLCQHWYTGGDPLQTVEGGWQVFPGKYGHNRPVLFVYWTADNYNQTGAYNLDSPGFIQVNNSFVIGGPWNTLSSDGGTQWGFRLAWYRDPATGNWWLYLQGAGDLTAIGYYPRELYGNGQMSMFATGIDYGGEVTGQPNSTGQVYTGRMGSGAPAGSGWQHAAFQKDIYYFPTGGNSAWANLAGSADTDKSYTVDVHNESSDPSNWGTYFFFGGPGGY